MRNLKYFYTLWLVVIIFVGCGNSRSPQQYFSSFISKPIPASVENLKASKAGFPDGFLNVSFKISESDLYSLDVLKTMTEVDSKAIEKGLKDFGGETLIQADLADYDKFYFRRDEATDNTRWHVRILVWNSKSQNAHFFFI